ncbi:MAG TPA: hypothetical protein PLD14_01375 [Candidatus Pacearchaeota archaeon]|nr:hypothetical protein [Candidatus Pacearchaeota archaeon]HPR79850.1 hypothetical protein [Candidatus Pacearchaeota archaeon]
MENQINYEETDDFRKDFKRLIKKYRTLEEDLEVVKKNTIELYHLKGIENQSIFPIPGFCNESLQICKIKKFACKALKGRGAMSGIRVIYAFHLTISKVEFIEIYFKGDKANEDKDRIRDYLRNIN